MQSGHAHINYQVNKKKITNTKKMQESIKSTISLLKRASKEGLTSWIKNAIKLASAKMKKYNVTMESLEKEAGVKIQDIKPATAVAKTYAVSKKGEGATKKVAKATKAAASATKKAPAAKAPTKKAAAPKKTAAAKKPPVKKAAAPKKAAAKKVARK